jgi:hypothetical protein
LPPEVSEPVLDALFARVEADRLGDPEDWVGLDDGAGAVPVGEEEESPWSAGVLLVGLAAGEWRARYERRQGSQRRLDAGN